MRCAILFLSFVVLTFGYNISAQEPEQNLSDFNLSGFAERGKKAWEISGKAAEIFNQTVNIKEVVARLYREEEDIELKAKEADFNKANGSLTLKKDVVVTTTKGATLTTDSLNWDRIHQRISTKDRVDIQRNNIIASALGAFAQTDLKKVNLEKDVLVQINTEEKDFINKANTQTIVITCDGPMEIDYEKNLAIFYNNVKIVKDDLQIYSDRLEIEFLKGVSDEKISKTETHIRKIHALGNVRIIKNDNISFSQEAVYEPQSKKIILTGSPRLILYPEEDEVNATFRN